MPDVLFVVGTRPNFPKVAPILDALPPDGPIRPWLLHTGQHYDVQLSDVFFQDLGLPTPDRVLGVGSGSHGDQTGRVLIAFEEVCRELAPDAVVVVGDVNSTLACALAAAKLQIPVAHVEAGLRSFDRSMPEELNRLLTDQIADRLYTHCAEADGHLQREGIPAERIRRVGNTMIDTLLRHRADARPPALWGPLGLTPRGYGLVTLHRPALVDDPRRLGEMIAALGSLAAELPLVYPVHPRTIERLAAGQLVPAGTTVGEQPLRVGDHDLHLVQPVRYLEFVHLMDHARLVLTDSGGVQEETTSLGVPCLTVRENTERAITIEAGTNQLVGLDPARMLAEARAVLATPIATTTPSPELWDGHAAERIVADLIAWLG